MNHPLFLNKYKLVFIGDSSVGKTSILNTYMKKKYTPKPTLGTEFSEKYIEKYDLKLQIWDCAGQERFRALTRLYYRGAHICVLVFDLSNPKSLNSIENYWINAVLENTDTSVHFILVGNKIDLRSTIDYKNVWDLCKKYNMKYIETSAINNTNIINIFNIACLLIKEKNTQHLEYTDTTNNTINNTTNIVNINTDSTTPFYNLYSHYC